MSLSRNMVKVKDIELTRLWYKRQEVSELFSIPEASWSTLLKKGQVPPPIRFSTHDVRYSADDLLKFHELQKQGLWWEEASARQRRQA